MSALKHGNLAVFVPHIGCPHQCSFCEQRIISGADAAPTPQDVAKLCESAIANANNRVLELAFFGGSFTMIDTDYMCALLGAAAEYVGKGISGIRISTRPDAVGDEMLSLLAEYPVSAIELGAQSMDDAVLKKNGRGHTAQEVIDASARIKRFGFTLGLQMMLGLDGEDEKSGIETAEKLIACASDTIRIYPTLVLENTELAQRMAAGQYRPLTLQAGISRTARVMMLFERAGVRIIRVGLHPSKSLEQKLLAGPYHPAFRELCEGQIMLERLTAQLKNVPNGKINVGVHRNDISRMTGQKRCNIAALKALGYDVAVVADANANPLHPIIIDN